jgi:hypothetical protein
MMDPKNLKVEVRVKDKWTEECDCMDCSINEEPTH